MNSIRDTCGLPKLEKPKRIDHYVRRLKRWNLIVRVGYGAWDLTPKGIEVLARSKELQLKKSRWNELVLSDKKPIRLEFCARILIPVIKELENSHLFDIERKTGEYLFTQIPHYGIGLTIQKTRKNNILVYVHHTELSDPADLEVTIRKVIRWTKEHLASRRIVLIDDTQARTSYLKYGLHDPMTKEAVPEKTQEVVDLGRPTEKVLPADVPVQAKAWFDKSPDETTIHSNSTTYIRRYLLMPETLANMEAQLGGLVSHTLANKNILLRQTEILAKIAVLLEKGGVK
jgi:hypothetical protein